MFFSRRRMQNTVSPKLPVKYSGSIAPVHGNGNNSIRGGQAGNYCLLPCNSPFTLYAYDTNFIQTSAPMSTFESNNGISVAASNSGGLFAVSSFYSSNETDSRTVVSLHDANLTVTQVTESSGYRMDIAPGSAFNKVFFCGGLEPDGTGGYNDTLIVQIYDASGTVTFSFLSTGQHSLGTGNTPNKIVFANGFKQTGSNSGTSALLAEAFDSGLTRYGPVGCDGYGTSPSQGTAGKFAAFPASYGSCAYDDSLTKIRLSPNPYVFSNCNSFSDTAIIAGGVYGQTYKNSVYALTGELSLFAVSPLSTAKNSISTAIRGNDMFLYGGYSGGASLNNVEVYQMKN